MLYRLRLFLSFCYQKAIPLFGLLLLVACKANPTKDLEETQKIFNSPEGCFSCQFFKIIYNTSAKLSAKAYDKMCDAALSLLIIGLMIWLIWHVLTLLVTLRQPNLAKFWIDLFQTLFKAGFVSILVTTKERVYEFVNSIMEPIALIFIDLSEKMLAKNWYSGISQTLTINSDFSAGPGFPASIGVAVENLIYRITLALNAGRILGLRLMMGSDFANFWLGFITSFMFLLMALIFPFYLIDGFIRLALVFLLLPIFMVCWVFKWSKHWAIKAWDMFIAAFAQVMIACIFIAIAIAVFEGFIAIRGYGYLVNPTAQNVDIIFQEEANRVSFSFLSFLMISFYLYNLSKNIPPLASHFTGAPAGNIMSKAIDRVKHLAKALALATLAIAATITGLSPVAKVAADQAKKDAEAAAKGGK